MDETTHFSGDSSTLSHPKTCRHRIAPARPSMDPLVNSRMAFSILSFAVLPDTLLICESAQPNVKSYSKSRVSQLPNRAKQ